MWKWTFSDKICGIILDKHSLLQDAVNFDYGHYCKMVKLFFYSESKPTLKICEDILRKIEIENPDIKTCNVIAISGDIELLKYFMYLHTGTIFVGKLEEASSLMYIPDFIIEAGISNASLSRAMASILTGERAGYISEVIASVSGNTQPLKGKKGYLLHKEISIEDFSSLKLHLWLGGRYYSYRNNYLLDDPLSYSILKFKDGHVKLIDQIYNSAISFLQKQSDFDLLTYVPLKPSEIKNGKYNRFLDLSLIDSKKENIKLETILKCNKDFSQKTGDLSLRMKNVKNAFETIIDVKDKNILILDDIYSTGSTLISVASELYHKGAKSVSAFCLAVNQPIVALIDYVGLKCPDCYTPMRLRMNRSNGLLFFGCTSGKKHRTYDLNVGVSKIKRENQIDLKFEIQDLIF